MANLNSERDNSLIGFLTPEYLGFLKLQVIPRITRGNEKAMINDVSYGCFENLTFSQKYCPRPKYSSEASTFGGYKQVTRQINCQIRRENVKFQQF
jgi:hypothetical protein